MKFTLHNPTFLETATTVVKGLGSNKDMQAQTLFKIIEEDGERFLLIQCRSQAAFFKGKIPLLTYENPNNDVEEWGIDGVQLKTILSVIPKYDSEIIFNMGNTVHNQFLVKIFESEFKLPVYTAPTISKEEELIEIATVDAIEFSTNVNNVLKAVATDTALQQDPLSCLTFNVNENVLKLFGSNAIEIAIIDQKLSDVDSNDVTALLKPSQANLLIKSSLHPNDTFRLVHTKNMFGYIDSWENLCLVSKTNLSPYNYSSIYNLISEEQSLVINKEDLKYAIDSLSKLCPTNPELTFHLSSDKVLVENENNDHISISAIGDVEDITIHLMKPSLSILTNLMSDKVKMNWANKSGFQVINFSLLDNDEAVIPNVFLSIVNNDK